jgi:O-methyltransferase
MHAEPFSTATGHHLPRGYWPTADFDTMSDADRPVVDLALPFTMTGVARLHALVIAVRFLIRAGVPGGFAECGVWRGGSMLAIAATLEQLGASDRHLYLFDTFGGMTMPSPCDRSTVEGSATALWRAADARGTVMWSELYSGPHTTEDAVRALVLSTGYPPERVHLVRGPVEETLPRHNPGPLALLRLDTDWYDSTRHEMHNLYPSLTPGGVLIIDDYGHWDGVRRAVDEYFAGTNEAILLNRIDYSCRLGVKPSDQGVIGQAPGA